jgi:hypothetical protein
LSVGQRINGIVEAIGWVEKELLARFSNWMIVKEQKPEE